MGVLTKLFKSKGSTGMNKTIADLAKEKNLAVEVVVKNVPAKGWRDAHKFKSDQIILTQVVKSGEDYHITYFGDATNYVRAAIVPPDFMFKMIDNDAAKAIVAKYEKYVLNNLADSCSYGGRIGSDPEIFVETAKGKLIPAFDFLGSKEKPTIPKRAPTSYSNASHNTLYWDGFQAEFTTDDSHCMGWHSDSLQAGLEGIWKAATAYKKDAKLSTKTVFDIPKKLLKTSKPEFVAFGCNPSLNAYGMNGLQAPGTAIDYRSAGGHVHLGMPGLKQEDYINMVKGMDAILGVAGVSMFAKFDDPRRRIMYGLAGEYRLPAHGVEYRVLSNAWLFHPMAANIVFDLARTAAMFGRNGLLKHWQATEQETIEVINTCNVEGARAILEKNKELMLALLNVKYYASQRSQYAFNVIMKGIESVVKDPTDLVKNWDLGKTWKTHGDGVGKNVQFALNAKYEPIKKKF